MHDCSYSFTRQPNYQAPPPPLNTLFVHGKYFCQCKRSLVVSPWFRVCVIISSQKVGIFVLCFLALTLDGSRTLNSQIASGRCSVLYPEDVETVSPEYISAPLSSCISFRFLLSGSCLIIFRRPGVGFFSYPSLSCQELGFFLSAFRPAWGGIFYLKRFPTVIVLTAGTRITTTFFYILLHLP